MNVRLVVKSSRITRDGFTSSRISFRNLQTASTISSTPSQTLSSTVTEAASPEPLTHYKITLRRSAIGLPKHIKATLESLGIFRRMQTVFHPHRPEFAGKILMVKELVEVQNVPASAVRTKEEMTRERRPKKGYVVVSRFGES